MLLKQHYVEEFQISTLSSGDKRKLRYDFCIRNVYNKAQMISPYHGESRLHPGSNGFNLSGSELNRISVRHVHSGY